MIDLYYRSTPNDCKISFPMKEMDWGYTFVPISGRDPVSETVVGR
jgi:hypothetical protein